MASQSQVSNPRVSVEFDATGRRVVGED